MRSSEKNSVKGKWLLLFGYFGRGNLGDELMLHAFLSNLRRLINFEAAVISSSPVETLRMHSMHSIVPVHKFNIAAIPIRIAGVNAVVGCGGSLLQDATSFRSLAYYTSLLMLSRCLGSKPIMLAQGLGPLKRRISMHSASLALRLCELVTFRDYASLELAIKLGAFQHRAYLTSDLSFMLAPPFEATAPSGQFTVAVAMRNWQGADEVAANIAQALLSCASQINSVRCISLSRDDLPLCERLCKQLYSLNATSIAPASICELWEAMRGIHLLIGVRLHSLILACMLGVPAVGISYDPKVKALMDSFAPQLCIPWDEASNQLIRERLIECMDDWIRLHELALQFARRSNKLSLRNLSLLLEVLG